MMLLRQVAQPFLQVRKDWNQSIITDYQLGLPPGHKPFTPSPYRDVNNAMPDVCAARLWKISPRSDGAA